MKESILVDLDGTLYDCEERRKKFLESKPDFDGFNAAAIEDKPHEWCVRLCEGMHATGMKIHFISGREDKHRATTLAWLRAHLWWWSEGINGQLLMRRSGDYRPDADIKRELVFSHLIDEKIVFVVDDRKKVVYMWRSIGLTALHCAVGDF